MKIPSPAATAALGVVPKPRVTASVLVSEIAVTSIFSPVRAMRITSPTVKIYAEEDPAPVTSIDDASSVAAAAARA